MSSQFYYQAIQVTDQVMALLNALRSKLLSGSELMAFIGLSHKATFLQNYLNPALESDLIERTEPDSPRSPKQRYRLTVNGKEVLVGE